MAIDPGPAAQTMGPFKGRRNAQGRYVALAASSGDGGDTGNGDTVYKAPGVMGDIYPDAVVTIQAQNGEDFGAAPVVANHEDFRSGAGKHNESMDLENSERLAGQYYNGYATYFTEDYRSSGASAILARYENGQSTRSNLLMTTSPNNESDELDQEFYGDVFVSYAIKVPGHRNPYGQREDVHPGPKEFSGGSDWKLAWLMQGNRGDWDGGTFGGNDVVVPTLVSTSLSNTGNNGGRRTDPFADQVTDDYWPWDEWARLSIWMSDTTGQYYTRYERPGAPVFEDSGPLVNPVNQLDPGNGMNVLKICSWLRDIDVEGLLILMDDIYWSVGPQGSSRVEVLNSPGYADSTKSNICKILSWTPTEIQVQILPGPNAMSEIQNLSVITAGNSVVTSRPLTVVEN